MSEQQKKRTNRSSDNLSASKIRGIRGLIALLLLYQIALFIYNEWGRSEPNPPMNSVAISSTSVDSTPSSTSSSTSSANTNTNAKANTNSNTAFTFNPNTISLDSLTLLGLSRKQAQTILNYRAKGGVFREPKDFAKMYVVDEQMYNQVKSRIVIPTYVNSSSNRQVSASATTKPNGSIISVNSSQSPNNESSLKKSKASSSNLFGTINKSSAKTPYICNLNSADSAALVKLYGIGPYYAKKIIEYRERLGGSFVAPEQLMEIYGVDSTKFNSIKKQLYIDSNSIKKFALEEVDIEFLKQHPYIGAYAARGITLFINMRRENSSKKQQRDSKQITAQELIDNSILSKENALRLGFYLK